MLVQVRASGLPEAWSARGAEGRACGTSTRRLFAQPRCGGGDGVLGLARAGGAGRAGADALRYDEVKRPDVWFAPLQHGHLFGNDALGRDCWRGCYGPAGLAGLAWWRPSSPW